MKGRLEVLNDELLCIMKYEVLNWNIKKMRSDEYYKAKYYNV